MRARTWGRALAMGLTGILAAIPAASRTGDQGAVRRMSDPVEGAALAQSWCSECHEVGPMEDMGSPSLLPAFRDVVRDPAFTEMAFRAFLQTPHGGMPNFIVSPEQAGDLYAYLETLRKMGER